MFKSRAAAGAGEGRDRGSDATRRRIFETALTLFRGRGFEQTTMRDIAAAAGLSLGAAYYYFTSKEAIVGAYYDYVQQEHAARCLEVFEASTGLRDRLRTALHTKVDILQEDRRLLRALFRYGADPEHPLSWFGPATRRMRVLSVGVFAAAVERERFPADLRDVAPTLLWALHMGLLLYFVFDDSPDQRRTRRLIDAVVDLVVDARRIVSSPLLRPLRRRVITVLGDAGLVEPAPARPGA